MSKDELLDWNQWPKTNGSLSFIPRFLATLEVDPKHRYDVYHFSLVYGFSTAAGFLLLTLLFKLVYFLLQT